MENIVYSWKENAYQDVEKTKNILKEFSIKYLYQLFHENFFENINEKFLKEMLDCGITVYHLCGEREWGIEDNAKGMIKEIDKILNFNQKSKIPIQGIVFDVESYVGNRDNFDFKKYLDNMILSYNYAHKNNLYVVIAIPIWFDKINISYLETLISSACDEVSLMNYTNNKTLINMENEINFAKKYDKNINTIYQVEFGLSENTFSSYQEIDDDYKKISEHYKYDKLKKAYHHLEDMHIVSNE